MRCPVCPEAQLVMSERHGIEIDYCPQCRGVWLDRGELDKIIERAAPGAAPENIASAPQPIAPPAGTFQPERRDEPRHESYRRDDDRRDYRKDDDYRRDDYYRKKKKRGGFLDDLFDFD